MFANLSGYSTVRTCFNAYGERALATVATVATVSAMSTSAMAMLTGGMLVAWRWLGLLGSHAHRPLHPGHLLLDVTHIADPPVELLR